MFCSFEHNTAFRSLKKTGVMLQGAWDLALLGRYFALAALVLCLLALVVVLLRKVPPSCAIEVHSPAPCSTPYNC